MKKIRYTLIIGLMTILFYSCFQEEWENNEQFVKEISIISSESTSANTRELQEISAYTFVDTIKYLNLEYDSDTIKNHQDEPIDVIFKIGIGGSLANEKDEVVKIKFDAELLRKFNILKGLDKKIPDFDLIECNHNFNKTDSIITVKINKGEISQALKFTFMAKRKQVNEYYDYAFPIKIVDSNSYPIHKYNNSFLSSGFVVDSSTVVNWSGIPIPQLPLGKYVSAQLKGNGGENHTPDGKQIIHKYITKLARNDEPELEDHYMIWGTSAWSFGMHGFHGTGWMYNKLYLNNADFGTYTLEPIIEGDIDFPYYTFRHNTVQKITEESKYDPRSKTLTVYYSNVTGQDYTDVLTYVGEDWSIDKGTTSNSCGSWHEVRNRGYKYWLPIDDEE